LKKATTLLDNPEFSMKHACSLIALLSQAVFAQPQAKPPEFEVADVKVSKSNNPEQGKGGMTGGRIDLPNVTLKSLTVIAYNVSDNMIVGAPGWIDSDRFDVVAKTAPDTPPDTMRAMFRTFLGDRFKLALHREDKQMPVYEMIVAKGGHKLQPATGTNQTCKWNNLGDRQFQRECHNMTMQELATQMPGWSRARIDLPVVDSTGIQGAYDFKLQME
jgi:uncharacterized protein (TIGR03435 family)